MPPEALSDAMTDTLTPQAAARVLTDAAGFEASLQQRTEGLTQMVWALAGPAIFMTYAFAEAYEPFPSWGYAFAWIPWVLAGGMTTGCLWRSAGLAAPNLRDPIGRSGYVWRFVALTTTLSLIFTLWDPDHMAAPLLVVGGMYLLMGLLNFYKISARGRRLYVVVGVVMLAAGGALVLQPESGLVLLATLLTAWLVPLAAGYWQTMTA